MHQTNVKPRTNKKLSIDWIGSYAVSAIFQPCKGEKKCR